MMLARTILLLLLGFAACGVRADYLEVRRPAVVRSIPRGDAAEVVKLAPGDRVVLSSNALKDRYYLVVVNGQSGWIYHTLVRRYPGNLPLEPAPLSNEAVSREVDAAFTATATATREETVFDTYDSYDPNGRWYTYAKLPRSVGYPNQLTVLKNIGFVVGYDEERKDPAWACYRCFRFDRQTTPARPSWKQDKRTTAGVTTSDYTNTAYSRGHMAPNYAIFQCYGRVAQFETFLMTNVCPQYQSNNDGIWGDIEDLISNRFAQEFGEVWVIAGPIFSPTAPHTIGRGVEVPTAFFMVIVDETSAGLRVLAFRVPHTDSRGTRPEDYLTSVDEIEAQTGLDFLSGLSDSLEEQLESKKPDAIWPVNVN
jgi:endonuclease G